MGKKIVFLHPDLGIGGAERLVVDAALALHSKGHQVSFITSHHDLSHCFAETKDGSFPVTVVGDWIPRNIFGRFYALFAYVRMIYAAFYLVFFSKINPDVIFCDIISACIPVLGLSGKKVIYYCHFPDQLLSLPGGCLKKLYRAPLDWLEEVTTACANVILVNSEFTRTVFHNTFKSIQKNPEILYPSINTDFFNQDCSITLEGELGNNFPSAKFTFLSINRYERKKNIDLALTSFAVMQSQLDESEWQNAQLIIAGGFDNRVSENIEYFEELQAKARHNNIEEKVYFLKSPSDLVKLFLLKHCDCLLYTPSNEHFGIVPLEAMYSQKPVIAINSGGPMETVLNGVTGFLCNPTKEDFALAMVGCIRNLESTRKMGIAGRKRFDEKFSFGAFRTHLNSIIESLTSQDQKSKLTNNK